MVLPRARHKKTDSVARVRASRSPLIRPILQRLRDPHHPDAILARQIRDRARDAQRTMHRACTHAAAIHRVGDQPVRRGIQRAVFAQRNVRKKRVEGSARCLSLSRCEYALANDCGGLACGSSK